MSVWQGDRIPLERISQGTSSLGAPLARLLLQIELEVLNERLPGPRLAVPASELKHTIVSEGRGIVALPVAWDPASAGGRQVRSQPATVAAREAIDVTVTRRRMLTDAVVELTIGGAKLQPLQGGQSPWRCGFPRRLRAPTCRSCCSPTAMVGTSTDTRP